MAVSLTGGALGGNNHYIKWAPEASLYWSPFHIPFLKDWNCVFEFRGSGTFLTKPLGDTGQDYSRNQWIPDEDRLLLGGPETLRGWDYYDSKLPESWRTDGLFDRVLYGVEFRVPIHPQMLWMVFFFDAGSLWSDSYWVKQLDEDSEARIAIEDDKSNNKVYDVSQMFDREVDLMTYFKYGYGVGFRIQIPMMPLRFWFGRKMIYDGDRFETLDGYNFQFQIGDYRY
jgi:outer membrane protein insertion porin family